MGSSITFLNTVKFNGTVRFLPPWVLATGFWQDSGSWKDTSTWID